ncbi:MAG: hypothetical protein ACI4OZ_02410 [Akkermansia sp.]
MKRATHISLALLAAMACGSALAVGPSLDKVVADALPNSGASISKITQGAYIAAAESPGEADVVFERILKQRTNWKSSEVYAILRAVLLAVPALDPYMPPALEKVAKEYTQGNATARGTASNTPTTGTNNEAHLRGMAENIARLIVVQNIEGSVYNAIVRNVRTAAPSPAEQLAGGVTEIAPSTPPTPETPPTPPPTSN